jgi:hypothetical protein
MSVVFKWGLDYGSAEDGHNRIQQKQSSCS